jgi:DNA repair protein RadC
MDTPEGVFAWLLPIAEGLSVEKFWALSLNRKNRLIRCEVITSGTATASLVHPREVFRPAIRNSATAIICAHNHPSGDPSPSQADIRVTKQLREAAKIVQIDLLDHIIIGSTSLDPAQKGFYSFAESGLL